MKMVSRAVVIQSLIAVMAVVYNMQGNVDGLKLNTSIPLTFFKLKIIRKPVRNLERKTKEFFPVKKPNPRWRPYEKKNSRPPTDVGVVC